MITLRALQGQIHLLVICKPRAVAGCWLLDIVGADGAWLWRWLLVPLVSGDYDIRHWLL